MIDSHAVRMKARIRADLVAALKRRDRREAALLRGLIAALDNAEAAPIRSERASISTHAFQERTAEGERLVLSAAQIRAVLAQEIAARERAAIQLSDLGEPRRAEELRAELEIARRYLEL